MSVEPNLYVCRSCGAEVKIIRKTVPDPKCPTLLCCGKPMTAKELPSVTTESDAKKTVKARYDLFAERGGAAACCVGETPRSPSFATRALQPRRALPSFRNRPYAVPGVRQPCRIQ